MSPGEDVRDALLTAVPNLRAAGHEARRREMTRAVSRCESRACIGSCRMTAARNPDRGWGSL
jgi:hypothetical protein